MQGGFSGLLLVAVRLGGVSWRVSGDTARLRGGWRECSLARVGGCGRVERADGRWGFGRRLEGGPAAWGRLINSEGKVRMSLAVMAVLAAFLKTVPGRPGGAAA